MTDVEMLGANWNALGERDPLWAVLTSPTKEGGRWNVKEFFATGRTQVDDILRRVENARLHVKWDRALDFGCGVGRLTLALAQHFKQPVGVDVAASMVRRAERFNVYPHRCRFVLNTSEDLDCFEDESFDFICSYLVLQHIPPLVARRYLAEWARVLAPGGVMAFQATSGPAVAGMFDLPDEAYRARLTLERVPEVVARESCFSVEVKVRNDSWRPWPVFEDERALKVGNHWREVSGGHMLRQDDGRTTVPVRLEPGDDVRVPLVCSAPLEPGRYILEVDLVHEGFTWFSARGTPVAQAVIEVVEELPGDSDGPDREDLKHPLGKMEMFGLPVGDIVTVLDDNDVTVQLIRNDGLAGPGWRSYEYFAFKPS